MKIELPDPATEGVLERALDYRRSVRTFSGDGLTLEHVSQILWAGIGINAHNKQTAPSGGAMFPAHLMIYLNNVQGAVPGTYSYCNQENDLTKIDLMLPADCCGADPSMFSESAFTIMLCAMPERSIVKYERRGHDYTMMEIGAIMQNIYLQCQVLGLSTRFIGAVRRRYPKEKGLQTTLFGLMPVGHARTT